MSKSFISILGTNNYLECRHKFNGNESDSPVKYAQEDLIKFFCSDFGENDEIRIFLTNQARKKNWKNDGHGGPNEGLESRLKKLELKCRIKDIDIPDGNNEIEIWQIFEIILNTFQKDENVIIDITHSFRFLPMLLTTLLNYAKYQKNISINGIYYAAFEVLGPINEVIKIPVEQRVVPIFDLTSLSELQDWTTAAFDFINNANVSTLKSIIKKNRFTEQENFLPRKVVDDLDKLITKIALCRGQEILEFNFEELKKNILTLKKINNLHPPFTYLIDELYNKIQNLNNNLNDLTIEIAEWCFKHNYFQQLITLLQEFTITLILKEVDYDITDLQNREIVSQAFNIRARNIPENNWELLSKEKSEITNTILKSEILNKLYSVYQTLKDLRNDINHGGFLQNARNVDRLKSKIQKTIDDYKAVLKSNL